MDRPTGSQPSFIRRVLFSPGENRLRAGWRIIGQIFLLFVFTLIFALLLGGLLFLDLAADAFLLVEQVIAFLAITISVYLARRLLDKRTFASLGLAWNARAARDLLAGLLIAAVMMALIFLVQWLAGWLVVENFAWETQPFPDVLTGLLVMLVIFIFVGWNEELFSRGYHLQNLADGLNLFWGVVLSSLAFAILHFANPAFTASVRPFLGLFLAGLFLAYGYLRTRQLWLPIGLHIGWNFFEGPVFGFEVSGLNTPRLVEHVVGGPEWVTGGAFGPEAGLILLPALALGVALIYAYTRSRDTARAEPGAPAEPGGA